MFVPEKVLRLLFDFEYVFVKGIEDVLLLSQMLSQMRKHALPWIRLRILLE